MEAATRAKRVMIWKVFMVNSSATDMLFVALLLAFLLFFRILEP